MPSGLSMSVHCMMRVLEGSSTYTDSICRIIINIISSSFINHRITMHNNVQRCTTCA